MAAWLTKEAAWCVLIAIFILSYVFGVFGITLLRQFLAERERRGGGLFLARQDFTTFYLPVWGRMIVWVASLAITAFTLKAFGV